MKDPRVYLAHILECIERIERFTLEGQAAFLADRMTQDAVLRNLEVIGEAAMRDVLIHDYEGVDLARVWRVIEHEFAPLKAAITALLPPLDQLEKELAGEE
jgi:uncharacterized protein with HEPN domain